MLTYTLAIKEPMISNLVSENVVMAGKHRRNFHPEFCHCMASTGHVVIELLECNSNGIGQVAQRPLGDSRLERPGIFVFGGWQPINQPAWYAVIGAEC